MLVTRLNALIGLMFYFVILSRSAPTGNKTSLGLPSHQEFFDDCEDLIDLWPRDTPGVGLPARFAYGGTLSPIYTLPAVRRLRSCAAVVTFVPGHREDYGSWQEIVDNFDRMNEEGFREQSFNIRDAAGRGRGIWMMLFADPDHWDHNATVVATS